MVIKTDNTASPLSKILKSGDLDEAQSHFFKKYEHDKNFIKILESKTYNKIADTIDYFRLVELEDADMKIVFNEILFEKEMAVKQAQEIKNCFKSGSKSSKWKKLTTPEDVKNIEKLCNTLGEDETAASEIFVSFFNNLLNVQVDEKYLSKIPDDWYSEPWYYTYVQYFGTNNGKGDFGTLKNQLDYLEELGTKNIYILPHYETPNGDAGFDISDYKPANELGGEAKFREFMAEATKRGFRVVTDLVFNHTSSEHKWFLKALNGESKYFDYYLKCPPFWGNLDVDKILKDENGDLFLYLEEKDENGDPVVSKRILIFPDIDNTVWLRKKIEKLNKEVLFYREFYPFQVDLDLQNPKVVNELFAFLGEELSMGVLGKRTDAIAHWIKKPGTSAKGLPETYALQMLIKQFLKHTSSKTVIMPEVVTTSKDLKTYAGEKTIIKGKETTTSGDVLLDFQLQGMLREMMYFEKTTPFWTQVYDLGEQCTNTAINLLPIEHHDETYMGFIQELEAMREYIEKCGGIVYKNGMSAGARYANCLNEDVRKIAAAFFCQYMMPSSPAIYYGSEIGATNRYEQMKQRQLEQFNTLKNLLGDDIVGEGKPITIESCEDPRELQRGSLNAELFTNAISQKYPAVDLIRKLNIIRKEKSALRSYNLIDVDTWSESILGMIRFPDNEDEHPILALSNLSGNDTVAKIPHMQLKNKAKKSDFKLRKLLKLEGKDPSSASVDVEVTEFPVIRGEYILVDLKAYSCLLLEIV